MRRPSRRIAHLLVLLAGAAAGCRPAGSGSAGPAAAATPGPVEAATAAVPKPDLTVSAVELIKDYAGGKDAADRKYKGKTVRVTGTVLGVKTNADGVTVVQLNGEGGRRVDCGIAAAAAARAKALAAGQTATLQGECSGSHSEDSVSVDLCEFTG